LWSGSAKFGSAGAFSLAINLLYLAGPLYMLQVYDRVVPSASHTTLVMLTLALLLAYLTLAGSTWYVPRYSRARALSSTAGWRPAS